MLLTTTLLGAAFAGGLDLAVDPGLVSTWQATYAVYGPEGYGGMVLVDGSPTREGGATLVVRYLAPAEEEAAWLEGVTVDAEGALVSVVRREGRRMRTLTVGEGAVQDVVTEGKGGTPLSSRSHAVTGRVTSPWLLPLVLPAAQARGGDTWTGALLDGQQVGLSPSILTAQGRQEVGGGRKALVAQLVPGEGPVRSFIYDDELVSAIVEPQARVQWVAAPRDEVQATHERAGD